MAETELKQNSKGLAALVIGGLILWNWAKKLPKGVTAPAPPAPPVKPLVKPPALPPKPPKQPITEQPRVSLDTWQAATPRNLKTLRVVKTQNIPIGGTTYNPTPKHIAIGDTGFRVWGRTETGATVVSKNDPESYPAWEWM